LLLILGFSCRTYVSYNGEYHDKNHVALYLFTYHELPNNYTEKYGSTQPTNGDYIGGQTHRYENDITRYTSYTDLRECDVDYPTDTNKRGLNRLVYSVGCEEIYYTNNHYGQNKKHDNDPSFYKLTKFGINVFSNIMFIFASIMTMLHIAYYIYVIKKGNDEEKDNIKKGFKDFIYIVIGIIITPFYLLYLIIKKVIELIKK